MANYRPLLLQSTNKNFGLFFSHPNKYKPRGIPHSIISKVSRRLTMLSALLLCWAVLKLHAPGTCYPLQLAPSPPDGVARGPEEQGQTETKRSTGNDFMEESYNGRARITIHHSSKGKTAGSHVLSVMYDILWYVTFMFRLLMFLCVKITQESSPSWNTNLKAASQCWMWKVISSSAWTPKEGYTLR